MKCECTSQACFIWSYTCFYDSDQAYTAGLIFAMLSLGSPSHKHITEFFSLQSSAAELAIARDGKNISLKTWEFFKKVNYFWTLTAFQKYSEEIWQEDIYTYSLLIFSLKIILNTCVFHFSHPNFWLVSCAMHTMDPCTPPWLKAFCFKSSNLK